MAFIVSPDYYENRARPIVYEVDLVGVGTRPRPVEPVLEAMSEWATENLVGTHSYSEGGNSSHQRGKDAPTVYKEHSTWRFETDEDAILFQLRWGNSRCHIRPQPDRSWMFYSTSWPSAS